MTRYRLFFFDRENRLAGLTEVHCDTDTEAVEAAQSEAAGRRIEIWHETHKVSLFGMAPSRTAPYVSGR
jgi:hypothetical protein